MLKLALHELGARPRGVSGTVSPEGAPWTDVALTFVEPPRVDLTVRETGDGGIHVTGWLRGTVEQSCRRCLEAVRQELEIEVDWLFEPGLDADAEDEGVFPLDEEEGELDLTPRIREEFLLEAPAYPLCDEECGGLCPVCGTNQNESSCECDTSVVDPRWGPLEDLASS